MSASLEGAEQLSREFSRLSALDFDAVAKKSLVQIYNRGKNDGGTPVDTGELRLSLTYDSENVGYTKDYAPHVEYGHRTVWGGYVEGQYFLRRNVKEQQEIFYADLRKLLNKGE